MAVHGGAPFPVFVIDAVFDVHDLVDADIGEVGGVPGVVHCYTCPGGGSVVGEAVNFGVEGDFGDGVGDVIMLIAVGISPTEHLARRWGGQVVPVGVSFIDAHNRIDQGLSFIVIAVEIFDMHPIPIEYGDERWFTLMISYLDTEFPENLIESEEVVLTGERSGTTVWVNFTDNTASMIGDYVIVYGTNTTNGSVYVKKLFTHNVDSWSESFTVNPYDSFIVVVYYNNSIWKKQCRTITISGIRSTFSTNTIDTFLIALVGYSPFGWGNLLLWFMLIAGCYYSDGEYAGLIILLLGGLFLTLNMVFGWESTLFTVAGGLIPSLFCLIGVLSLWSERHKGLFKGGG